MSYQMSFRHVVTGSGGTLENTPITVTGTSRVGLEGETVATGQSNIQMFIAIDVSAVKGFYLLSDRDVTFETNSGSAADNTINLKANQPYAWHTDQYDAFLLTVDVTSVFITNASGATATIRLEAIMDATP